MLLLLIACVYGIGRTETEVAGSKSMACPLSYYKVCKQTPSGFDCKCKRTADEAAVAKPRSCAYPMRMLCVGSECSCVDRGSEMAVAKPEACNYPERMLCVNTRDGVECNCVTRQSGDEEAVGDDFSGGQPPKDCQVGDTWTSDDFCSRGDCVDLGEFTTWMTSSMGCYLECRSDEEIVDVPGQCCPMCAPIPPTPTCDASECKTPCKGKKKKRKCAVEKDSICSDTFPLGKGKKKKWYSKKACKAKTEETADAMMFSNGSQSWDLETVGTYGFAAIGIVALIGGSIRAIKGRTYQAIPEEQLP